MPGPDALIPQPGEVLAGKYEVLRGLAEGGMGVVLEARHIKLGHRVAVKVLRAEVRSLPQVAARFDREARAAARLRGPHSVRVTDVDALADGSPFMVMEMLEGHDLSHAIDTRGALPVEEAVGYVVEACTGMAEAHALGIVHRDLKPSNLFLAREGDLQRLKVLDFGISKVASDGDVKMTATSSVLGTPLYMSPEQIRSAKNVDERTDIWSLGVILYELLTGRPPFDCESATGLAAAIVADEIRPVRELRPDLDAGLAAVVMKALEKKADRRFQSVLELAQALAPHASDAARASLRGAPPGRPEAPTKSLAASKEAPTLERADTLVAAPPARATEPGWSATPAAPKARSGLVVGFAIAAGAMILGGASWLALGGSDAGGDGAERAYLPAVPEQGTALPEVTIAHTAPLGAGAPSASAPGAPSASAVADPGPGSGAASTASTPPAPRAPSTGAPASSAPPPRAPAQPAAAPTGAKNPLRL